MSATPDTFRVPALDALRGVAVLLVVAFHARFRFAVDPSDPIAYFLGRVGWIGVDLFFALSGFLIVGILMRLPERSPAAVAGFFRRRIFRIIPLFLVAIATYFFASIVVGHEVDNLRRLWIPALLLNGWVIPFLGVENVPYTLAWSLSVEEFAYVVLGCAALISRRAIVATVLGCIAVALLVRWSALAWGWTQPELLYYFVPARLDAIGFGALGALGFYGKGGGARRSRLAAGTLVAILVACLLWIRPTGVFLPAIGYTVFALAAGMWVKRLSEGGARAGAFVRSLAALGEVSYFIYLFHMFFLDGIRLLGLAFFGQQPSYWLGLTICVAVLLVAGRVSWHWFELPLIRRGRLPASGVLGESRGSPS